MTWVLWILITMVGTSRGRSRATFVKVLAQSECGRFCHFGNCGPKLDCHHAEWHGNLLRAKGMVVLVGLPVDRVSNGGSDVQAGVEIYY